MGMQHLQPLWTLALRFSPQLPTFTVILHVHISVCVYIYVWSGSAYTGLDGCKPQQTNFFSLAKNQTGPNQLPLEAQPNHPMESVR